jgi:hypothetical protein
MSPAFLHQQQHCGCVDRCVSVTSQALGVTCTCACGCCPAALLPRWVIDTESQRPPHLIPNQRLVNIFGDPYDQPVGYAAGLQAVTLPEHKVWCAPQQLPQALIHLPSVCVSHLMVTPGTRSGQKLCVPCCVVIHAGTGCIPPGQVLHRSAQAKEEGSFARCELPWPWFSSHCT